MSDSPQTISPALDYLSCEAIGYCLDLIAEGQDLWPTLFTYEAAQAPGAAMQTQTFQGDTLDACLLAAYDEVQQAGCTCYAIGYDGAIQDSPEDEALQAVILEFAEKGMATAFTACTPYRLTVDGLEYGSPVPGGEEPLRFA